MGPESMNEPIFLLLSPGISDHLSEMAESLAPIITFRKVGYSCRAGTVVSLSINAHRQQR